jgi:hypothetical protein
MAHHYSKVGFGVWRHLAAERGFSPFLKRKTVKYATTVRDRREASTIHCYETHVTQCDVRYCLLRRQAPEVVSGVF